MEFIITIKIKWWDENNKDAPTEARDTLRERGEERVCELYKEGYTSGELITEIEGKAYQGHWELTRGLPW